MCHILQLLKRRADRCPAAFVFGMCWRVEIGIEVMVTLWGEQAESFDCNWLHENSSEGNATILFVGTLASEFLGMLAFRATPSTRWYFDPPIPEVNTLLESLGDVRYFIQWDDSEPVPADPIDSTLNFLGDQPLSSMLKKKYKLNVVITQVKVPQVWWFSTCEKCRKGMNLIGNAYVCPKCHRNKGKYRYKLSVSARDVDPTDRPEPVTGQFTFWGNSGAALTGRSAELLVGAARDRVSDYVPPLITASVGKKCTVIAEVSQETNDADPGIVVLTVSEAYLINAAPSSQQSSSNTSPSAIAEPSLNTDLAGQPLSASEGTKNAQTTPVKDVIEEANITTDEVPDPAPDDRKRKNQTASKNGNKKSLKDGPRGQLFPPVKNS